MFNYNSNSSTVYSCIHFCSPMTFVLSAAFLLSHSILKRKYKKVCAFIVVGRQVPYVLLSSLTLALLIWVLVSVPLCCCSCTVNQWKKQSGFHNTSLCFSGWVQHTTLIPFCHFLCCSLSRFDTYRSKDESRRLAKYLDDVETGLILAMVVNDEGSNNLEDSAKKNLTRLGSRHITSLGFR